MTFHKDNSVRRELIFNAQNSNSQSWFNRRKLTKCSWTDLPTFEPIPYFTMEGACDPITRICINYHVVQNVAIAKCDNIFGWMYRGTYDHCPWEKANLNNILYCKEDVLCNFQDQGEFRVRGFFTTSLSQS